MRSPLLIATILLSSIIAKAQDNFGIFESDYSTTNAIQINPANGVLSKQYLDFNVIGAKAFFNNNLIYVSRRNYSFRDVLNQDFEAINLEYDLENNKNKGYMASVIWGPSFVYSANNHSFGFQINNKSYGHIRNVPNYMVDYYAKDELPTLGTYEARNMRADAVSFVEFGGSYSTNIMKQGNIIISAGGQLNYLVGLAGAGGIVSDALLTIDSTGIVLNNFEGEYMYSDYGWNTGRGLSTHLGINFAIMEQAVMGYNHNMPGSECQCFDHKLKVGASLIDMGYVNFKKTANYRNYAESPIDPAGATSLEIDEILAESITTGSQNVWSQSKVYLPGAVSVQVDYKVKDYFFLSGSYIHGFRKGQKRFGVQRARVMNFTPRFEMERFEIGIPVSLYEFTKPQLGLALRLNNNLIIGTDKIGALTGGANLYGADLYFHLKFGIIKNPACKEAHRTLKERRADHRNNSPSSKPRKRSGKEKKYACPDVG